MSITFSVAAKFPNSWCRLHALAYISAMTKKTPSETKKLYSPDLTACYWKCVQIKANLFGYGGFNSKPSASAISHSVGPLGSPDLKYLPAIEPRLARTKAEILNLGCSLLQVIECQQNLMSYQQRTPLSQARTGL